jgi:hypothetical protein
MRERNAGTLKSGRSGKKVTSRKQAIAIGLSEARRSGARVPKKSSSSRTSRAHRRTSRATGRTASRKTATRRASGNTRRRTSSRSR